MSNSLREYLRHSRSGTILATFRRSCYIDLDGRIAALVAPELLNGPLNIVVAIGRDFFFDRLQTKSSVSATPTLIVLDGSLHITLSIAQSWDAALTPWSETHVAPLRVNLHLLRSVLLREAPKESFAQYLAARAGTRQAIPTEAPSSRVQRAMSTLVAGMRKLDLPTIKDGARQLAGLGSGLTPSGDDVLVGVLLALTIRPSPMTAPMRTALVTAAMGRTTRISDAYLEAAGRGEASEAWHRLLVVLPTGDPSVLLPAVRRVMAFGETSGADMLTGFVLALDAGS